jgi:hypothetical protein
MCAWVRTPTIYDIWLARCLVDAYVTNISSTSRCYELYGYFLIGPPFDIHFLFCTELNDNQSVLSFRDPTEDLEL